MGFGFRVSQVGVWGTGIGGSRAQRQGRDSGIRHSELSFVALEYRGIPPTVSIVVPFFGFYQFCIKDPKR